MPSRRAEIGQWERTTTRALSRTPVSSLSVHPALGPWTAVHIRTPLSAQLAAARRLPHLWE